MKIDQILFTKLVGAMMPDEYAAWSGVCNMPTRKRPIQELAADLIEARYQSHLDAGELALAGLLRGQFPELKESFDQTDADLRDEIGNN